MASGVIQFAQVVLFETGRNYKGPDGWYMTKVRADPVYKQFKKRQPSGSFLGSESDNNHIRT